MSHARTGDEERYRGKLTIDKVAKESGVSPFCLRIWEKRYGWPMPTLRNPDNGYRYYSPILVDIIKQFNLAGRPFDELEAGTWIKYRCGLALVKKT